jgi:hypothetical protein
VRGHIGGRLATDPPRVVERHPHSELGRRPKLTLHQQREANKAARGNWPPLAPDRAAFVHAADPWIRFITPSTPASGYFTITNVGAKPVVITGASSRQCGSIMLHKSMTQGGMESMQMMASGGGAGAWGSEVPAGGISSDVHAARAGDEAWGESADYDHACGQPTDHPALQCAGREGPVAGSWWWKLSASVA